jgi:DNA-binding response OmpR family regulator
VVAVTAYASDSDRAKALSAGFSIHVAKPVHPVEIVSVVDAPHARSPPPAVVDARTDLGARPGAGSARGDRTYRVSWGTAPCRFEDGAKSLRGIDGLR